jgi:hypothetical protein
MKQALIDFATVFALSLFALSGLASLCVLVIA